MAQHPRCQAHFLLVDTYVTRYIAWLRSTYAKSFSFSFFFFYSSSFPRRPTCSSSTADTKEYPAYRTDRPAWHVLLAVSGQVEDIPDTLDALSLSCVVGMCLALRWLGTTYCYANMSRVCRLPVGKQWAEREGGVYVCASSCPFHFLLEHGTDSSFFFSFPEPLFFPKHLIIIVRCDTN